MGKVCVITGATSGIGREVAAELVKRGFDLAVVGRDGAKGKVLQDELLAMAPGASVSYYVADMANMEEVKKVSARIAEDHPVIDVLINNAGGVFARFELTPEGIERTMANNHLGYFISTLMMFENVERSADGRIIIVSSGSHYKGKIDFESFTNDTGYQIMKAYEQSKLANVLFTYKLAALAEGSGVSVNCLHPGVVKTKIGNKTDSGLFSVVWSVFSNLFGISTAKSARTYVYLASEPEGRNHHSKYFHSGELKVSSKLSRDKKLQDDLWTWSEQVTGLSFRRKDIIGENG